MVFSFLKKSNDCIDGNQVVLMADSGFYSYNEDEDRVGIDMVPEAVEEFLSE